MKECARPYFILDGEVLESHLLDEKLIHQGTSIYEVIRLMEGKFLFLEDHLVRLFNSLQMAGIQPWVTIANIRETMHTLTNQNMVRRGNVKIIMNLQENGSRHFLAYFVYHRYPTSRDYNQGVKVITYPFERMDPNKKVWRPEFRRHVSGLLHDEGAFEALLTDAEDCITEASKANVFAIRNDQVITPPEAAILPGISRHYVLGICHDLGRRVIKRKIPLGEIPELEGLFLTGTSLHVLPVSSVDNHTLPVKHPLMAEIMNHFQQVINKYLK